MRGTKLSKFALFIAATACAALIGVGDVASQGAAGCLRTRVTAEGQQTMWNREADARTSASVAWMLKARQEAGAPYADWSKARAKEIKCRTITKSMIRCTATATPCK